MVTCVLFALMSLLVAHERSSAALQDPEAASLARSSLFPVLESAEEQVGAGG